MYLKPFHSLLKKLMKEDIPLKLLWVVPSVLAAAIGVSSKLYKELCIMDDIGNLHIQNSSHICSRILDDKIEEGRNEILDDISDRYPR